MWDYFERSKPREAKGGIKAQSKRGKFGESWWARRWIEVLEGFHLGARLGRGRTYARKGQVLNIDVQKGEVKAQVQGSEARPYRISIQLDPIPPKDWEKLITALSTEAIFAAKLLSGEMPEDIEKVFKDAKLSLFPTRHRDLHTLCSCPDSSNPCKHIAAVYYIIGEEFDRDPFLLFQLRGLTRDELLSQLSEAGVAADVEVPEEVIEPEPLPCDLSQFWGGGTVESTLPEEEPSTKSHAALLKRLGNFPFWRGSERFLDALEPIYRVASERGLNVVADAEDGEP